MSAKFSRIHVLVLISCVLLGCGGGGDSEPAPTADTQPDSTVETPTPPSGGTSTTTTSTSGPRIDSSTPDGTVKEAMAAVQNNEFERVWDLLPKNYQTDINDLFKEFGNQVDPEMWDKTFVLLSRYVSVMVAKQDMVYKTPDVQAALEAMKASAGASGKIEAETVTLENLKPLSDPLLKILMTLLNSEISSSKKLKSFDGRVFCAKTVAPVVENLTELSKATLAQYKKMATTENQEMPAIVMMSFDFENQISQQVNVRTESVEGDFAVVVIESGGREEKQNFVRVDGKWVPEMMGASFRPMLQFAKDMIPTYAAQINDQKPKVMPVLEQLEPLIDALQKAKTQDEFNTAFTNFNAQAPLLVASAMGPGFGSMMGGGAVKVSPVTIKLQVTGPMTDKQLSELISKLESLTDDPDQAITFPTGYFGADGQPVTLDENPVTVGSPEKLTAETINALRITPVSDPQIFADAIKAAEIVPADNIQFDPQTKIITLSLKFEAPQPAETPESEK